MPYIKPERRIRFDSAINSISENLETPGDINYCISKLLILRAKELGYSYATFNELMGVMDCASKEFYRTVVVPYEEGAIVRNGDII